jgi:hypothetical protein
VGPGLPAPPPSFRSASSDRRKSSSFDLKGIRRSDRSAALPGVSCHHAVTRVEQVTEGVWTIKTARVIPDDELWLHTPEMRASLDRALDWSNPHPRSETDLNAMAAKVKRKR